MAPKSLATNIPKIFANLQVGVPKTFEAIKNSWETLDLSCLAIDTYKGPLPNLRDTADKCYGILTECFMGLVPQELIALSTKIPNTLEQVDLKMKYVEDVVAYIDEWFGPDADIDEKAALIYMILGARKKILECGLYTKYPHFYPSDGMTEAVFMECVQADIYMKFQQSVAGQIPERFVPVQVDYQLSKEQIAEHDWLLWVQGGGD